MIRCKHCNSIVPEGSEVCKTCGKPLYEVEDDDRRKKRKPQMSMELWWAIIGLSVVIGFLSFLNDKRREEKMERDLEALRESTEMIQSVEADINEFYSDIDMPEIRCEDMKMSYEHGDFVLNEKASKPSAKYYENEDKTEVLVISMFYSDTARDITQNNIEENLVDEIGTFEKTEETYNGLTFSVYHFSPENKLSEEKGFPVYTDVYVYYVNDAYYVYIGSITTNSNGFSEEIEDVLKSIDITEK